MSTKKKPVIAQDLIWRVLDDGAVIITPDQGQVRVLNQVGAAIWQMIDGQNTTSDIALQLSLDFDVEAQEAEKDVRAFLDVLDEKGLLAWT